jgi:YD repeat-containing protein
MGNERRPVSESQRSVCLKEGGRRTVARFASAALVVIAALAWYGVPALAQQVTVTARSCTEAPRPPSDAEEWITCGEKECVTGCSAIVYDGWTPITRSPYSVNQIGSCYWQYATAEGYGCQSPTKPVGDQYCAIDSCWTEFGGEDPGWPGHVLFRVGCNGLMCRWTGNTPGPFYSSWRSVPCENYYEVYVPSGPLMYDGSSYYSYHIPAEPNIDATCDVPDCQQTLDSLTAGGACLPNVSCRDLDADGDGVNRCEDCDDDNAQITVRKDSPECPCERRGPPIAPVSGQMTHSLPLFTAPAAVPLSLEYDSTQGADRGLGTGWRTSWDAEFLPGTEGTLVRTPNGNLLSFTADGSGGWTPPDGTRLRLTGPTGTWPTEEYRLTWPDGRVRVYHTIQYVMTDGIAFSHRLTAELDRSGNATVLGYSAVDGTLDTVTNPFGRALHFGYANGHLATVSDDAGATYQLTYDPSFPDRLQNVVLQGGTDPGWTMIYEDRVISVDGGSTTENRTLLTLLTDPRGEQEARWDYDGMGRAILGEGAGGMEAVHPAYNPDGSRVVSDSLGNTSTYEIVESHDGSGALVSTQVSIDGCSSCGTAHQVRTYDAAHNLTSRTNANGVVTGYGVFNAWGSPGFEMRAVGTPEAQITTTAYHPLYDLPTSRTEAGPLGPVVTTWDFDDPANDPDPGTPNSQPTALIYRQLVQGQTLDAAGQPVPFTHVTAYTYNNFARKLSEDGPLAGVADTIRWAYCDTVADEPAAAFGWDPAVECPAGTNNGQGDGSLLAVISPTGQVTRYGGYDAAGRVGYVVDANGNRTDFTYDPYGRLDTTTRQADGAVTDYDYDPLGNLTALHLPEDNTITYTYDAGRRLRRITDDLGNYIQYTYDSESHRIKE